MIKCEVCGHEFKPTDGMHYIARNEVKFGLSAIAGSEEVKLYDAFDCPVCGCQIIVGERKRMFEEVEDNE